jgi:hypothetical protein
MSEMTENLVHEEPPLHTELIYAAKLLAAAAEQLEKGNPWAADSLLKWATETVAEVENALTTVKYDSARAIAKIGLVL